MFVLFNILSEMLSENTILSEMFKMMFKIILHPAQALLYSTY